MKEWVKQQRAYLDQSIREVIKIITHAEIGVALVVDKDDRLVGIVTDSDIRRSILKEMSLDTPVSEIMNKTPFTLPEGLTVEESIRRMRLKGTNRAPVVDENGVVVDIALYWKLQEAVQNQAPESVDFTFSVDKGAKDRKKILVIGAAGFVGAVLCRELLKEGYAVRGVDRFLFGDDSLKEIIEHPQFELVKADIRHLDVLVDSAFGVDAVVNLAAIVGDPACDLDVSHSIMVNYFSAKASADAARHFQVDRYIFASTCAVYGASMEGESLTETSPVAPVSLYAETKLKTEQGILSLANEHFSPCVMRLSTVYGYSPRMRFDLVTNLFILNALTKGELTVHGGKQWRPYVHVHDVARAILCALKADKESIHSQIFNLGSNHQNYRIIDLAKKIADRIPNTNLDIQERMQDNRNYYVCFDKIRKMLGFEAGSDIDTAVDEIKAAFDKGHFKDFSDKKYSNMKQQEHLVFG